ALPSYRISRTGPAVSKWPCEPRPDAFDSDGKGIARRRQPCWHEARLNPRKALTSPTELRTACRARRVQRRAACHASNDVSHPEACTYLAYVQANAGIEMSL